MGNLTGFVARDLERCFGAKKIAEMNCSTFVFHGCYQVTVHLKHSMIREPPMCGWPLNED